MPNSLGYFVLLFVIVKFQVETAQVDICDSGNPTVHGAALGEDNHLYVFVGDQVSKFEKYTEYDYKTRSFPKLMEGYPKRGGSDVFKEVPFDDEGIEVAVQAQDQRIVLFKNNITYVYKSELIMDSKRLFESFMKDKASFPIFHQIVEQSRKAVAENESDTEVARYELTRILKLTIGYVNETDYMAMFKFCFRKPVLLNNSVNQYMPGQPRDKYILFDGKYYMKSNGATGKLYRNHFHKHLKISDNCRDFDASSDFIFYNRESGFVAFSQDLQAHSRLFDLTVDQNYIKITPFGPKVAASVFIGCPPSLCMSPIIDAMLHTEQNTVHLFSGRWVFTSYDHKYQEEAIINKQLMSNYLASRTNYLTVPSYIDAAFYHPSQRKYYFFKEQQFYTYDLEGGAVELFRIASTFPDVGNNRVDGAVLVPTRGKIGTLHLFTGDSVLLYNSFPNTLQPTLMTVAEFAENLRPYVSGASYAPNGTRTTLIIVRREVVYYIEMPKIHQAVTRSNRVAISRSIYSDLLRCPGTFTEFQAKGMKYEFGLDPIDLPLEKPVPIYQPPYVAVDHLPSRIPENNPPPSSTKGGHYFTWWTEATSNADKMNGMNSNPKKSEAPLFPPFHEWSSSYRSADNGQNVKAQAVGNEDDQGLNYTALGLTFLTAFLGSAIAATVVVYVMSPGSRSSKKSKRRRSHHKKSHHKGHHKRRHSKEEVEGGQVKVESSAEIAGKA